MPQWFKGYWDDITGGQEIDDYDAVGRRQLCKTGDWKKVGQGAGAGRAGAGVVSMRQSLTPPCVKRQGQRLLACLPLPAPQFSMGTGVGAPRAAAAAGGTIPAVRRTNGSGDGGVTRGAPARAPAARTVAAAPAVAAAKPAALPSFDDSQYRSQIAELNDQVGGRV